MRVLRIVLFMLAAMVSFYARAIAALSHWRELFPEAEPEHHVFPHEKYGFAGNDRKLYAYEIIPTEPMHRWKVAWEGTRKAAKVSCRFHDLRQHAESPIMPILAPQLFYSTRLWR